MKNLSAIRDTRDFLSSLLDLPPKEAVDLLTNHGQDVINDLNAALGKEAFKIGDTVTAFPVSHNEFVGRIVGVKSGGKNEGWVFGVKDQEDDVFDCEAHEIIPFSE